MKAEDLMIGNYVIYNGKAIVVIKGITKNEITFQHSSGDVSVNTFPSDLFTPMPLNQEQYEKFGYECSLELINEIIYSSIIPVSDSTCEWLEVIDKMKVHELQNLYKIVMGKQLKYTEDEN